MIAADTLITAGFVVHGEHDLLFPEGPHGLRLQLHAPDRCDIGAAPIEIQAPVVITEEIGVPEREAPRQLLPLAVDGVLRTVKVAGLAALGGREVEILPHRAHVRRVIENRDRRLQRVILPVHHVVGDIEATRHGGKKPITALEIFERRVGGLTVDGKLCLSEPRHIRLLEVVFIGQIQGIAVVFAHGSSLSSSFLQKAPHMKRGAFPGLSYLIRWRYPRRRPFRQSFLPSSRRSRGNTCGWGRRA